VQDEQVISFLESNIFFRFGLPLEIITDNGPAFISTKLTQFLAKIGVKHFASSTYYPQGNGQVESTNKNLVRIMKRIIEEKPRDARSSLHVISASKPTHQCTWRNRFQGKGGVIPLILRINLKFLNVIKCIKYCKAQEIQSIVFVQARLL
jgi:transposase InsO family protein